MILVPTPISLPPWYGPYKPRPASPDVEVLAPAHNIGCNTNKYHYGLNVTYLVIKAHANTMRVDSNAHYHYHRMQERAAHRRRTGHRETLLLWNHVYTLLCHGPEPLKGRWGRSPVAYSAPSIEMTPYEQGQSPEPVTYIHATARTKTSRWQSTALGPWLPQAMRMR